MTDGEDPKQQSDHIRNLLLHERLREALEQMQSLMSGVSDWSVISKYEDIKRSYSYMLQYYRQGFPDQHRSELYRQLIRRSIILNDDILQVRQQPLSMLLYYQHLRSTQTRRESIEVLRSTLESFIENNDTKAHERALELLFDLLWTNGSWTASDSSHMKELIDSPLVMEEDSALAVSAVTLSLLERFDHLKCLLLCHAAQSQSMTVSVRALMGLVITLIGYSDILPYFTEIGNAIALLADMPNIQRRMLQVQMALLACRETKEIDRRMREEIIPSMIHNPKLGDIMREEMDGDGASPEWMEWMEKPEVHDKFMQISELQMEGADIYMSTFSHLKNYPFFRLIHNWFRVFSLEQPDVTASLGNTFINSPLAKMVFGNGLFCNSDKYSFALTLSNFSKEQSDMILGQMDEPAREGIDGLDMNNIPISKREVFTARQYAQDLYRFFNLFSRRHEFKNPFTMNLNVLQDSVLQTLIHGGEPLHTISSWLLSKEYYHEAVQAYGIMQRGSDPYSSDYRFYQQMGYALQRTQQYDSALESYRRADILQPDNAWTLRHMAYCLRQTGKREHALEILLQAEKHEPNNLSLQIQIGDCLVDLMRYDEALMRFFKVDYLKPDYPKAWRAIAWCAFLAGRSDRSIEYYDRLLAAKPTGNDYLNAGHAYLAIGQVDKAVSLYRQSRDITGLKLFETEFNKDRSILIDKGVCPRDLPLLLDLVQE